MSNPISAATAARPLTTPRAATTADSTVAKAALKALDWNYDGKLSRDEVDMSRLGKFDANRDMEIDQAEFSTAFGQLAAADQQAVATSLSRKYERPKLFNGLMTGGLALCGVGLYGLLRSSVLSFVSVLGFGLGGVALVIEANGKRNLEASKKADVLGALARLPQA